MDEGQQRVHDACALIRPTRGLYVWGPVGRGKTMLVGEYLETVRKPKRRMHFHEFFVRFHAEYLRANFHVGRALDTILGGAKVVFFDEFHVHDIGDAMLLHRAMLALASQRVTLLATSNYAPDDLLPNPLVHDRFIPTIELVKSTMEVVNIGAGIDYRTLTAHTEGFASGRWVGTGSLELPRTERVTLRPAGHPVVALAVVGHTAYFDFADLCERSTATADYVALAGTFSRWFVVGIPALADASTDAAIRFANVVDVLYDRDIEAVFVSAGPPTVSGLEQVPQFESARLASRLGQLRRV